MAGDDMSFDDINAGIERLDLTEFEKIAASRDAEAIKDAICRIWKGIRPIIVALSNFPLLPKKWRAALKMLIKLLDALCG